MRQGCLVMLAIWIGLFAAVDADRAAAGRRHRLLGLFDGIPASGVVESPEGVSFGPPGPHRYLPYAAGNYPWYGYGFGVPTYNWGYFGAHYRPFNVSHRGYYGDFVQWGYRRGY